MKNLFKLALLGAMTFSLTATAATMKELEQRIEDLEFKGYEDIFKFSGQIEMRYDIIESENKDTDKKTGDHGLRLWSHIDMSAAATSKLSFYGRLAMAKSFNNMADTDAGSLDSIAEGQDTKHGNSDIFFQRAFVNYQATNNFAFTFGRLPTANGTPYHLTRNESSGGAYPFLAYNAFLDGAALSYKLGNFNFKAVYTPFTFEGDTSSNVDFSSMEPGVYSSIGYEKSQNLSWARKFTADLSYFTGEVPIRVAQGFIPVIVKPLVADIRFAVKRTVLNVEVSQILNSKFDLNLQLMHSNVGTAGSAVVDSSGNPSYFLSNDGSSVQGNAGILTVRYAINDNNKVGVQYSQGSKNSFASDVIRKESIETVVPGSMYHVFYNHSFDGGLRMNVGYQANQIDYASPIQAFGERQEVDKINSSIYTAFVADF